MTSHTLTPEAVALLDAAVAGYSPKTRRASSTAMLHIQRAARAYAASVGQKVRRGEVSEKGPTP